MGGITNFEMFVVKITTFNVLCFVYFKILIDAVGDSKFS